MTAVSVLSACSLAPDFVPPEINAPAAYKEQEGAWKPAEPGEARDRGKWWSIFGDERLDALEQQAMDANPTLQAAASRVAQARAAAGAGAPSILPNLSVGANAVRSKPSDASLIAFGAPAGSAIKPYTLYSANGTLDYEVDLFGRVRDNYAALERDAEARQATYVSLLLALQADVAQHYFTLRALDAERHLLRDTVTLREEAQRIMQKRFEVGDAGEQELARTKSELSSTRAELAALDRQRAVAEHALAALLGKAPAEFDFPETPLAGTPPSIPAGLPSSLLERRPDIAAAQHAMAAANARIGVARAAFFPRILLTATGGYESTELSDLFEWSSRSWALGQMGGGLVGMTVFDSFRNWSRLEGAKAGYDEAVAAYREQVLAAFRDVEDSLAGQRLLAEQSAHLDEAAATTDRATALTEKRYRAGDAGFFEVVSAQRDSLAAARANVQALGQRYLNTVALIRALGGGWAEAGEDAVPGAVMLLDEGGEAL